MELMVAVSILSILVVLLTGIFLESVRSQRTALINQQLIGEARYVIEHIGRAGMLARVDHGGMTGYHCVIDEGVLKEGIFKTDENSVTFVNQRGNCMRYFLDEGVIKVEKNEVEIGKLTSSDFQVSQFNLKAQEEDYEKDYRLTIFIKMESEAGQIEAQTTISSRN